MRLVCGDFSHMLLCLGYYFQAPPSSSPPQDAWQRCIVQSYFCPEHFTHLSFGLTLIQVLFLRSTFGLFPHHFVEHFRGRCAQDLVFGKRLKLLAGLVLNSCLISCCSLQFSLGVGSHSLWASLWYARGIKRLEVARLWSSQLVSLVRCLTCYFSRAHQYLVRWVSAPSVPLEDCSFQSSSACLQSVSDVVSTPLDSFKGQQAPTSLLSDSTWWDRYL